MKYFYAHGARPLEGFTIQRGLGIGGFGEVYHATTDAGKEVALKRVQRNLEIELRGVTQCLNIKHPNLVAIYDIRKDADGEAWVVMEYISGPSLREVLARHPHGLPPDEVERWFRGIAAAVAHLHDHDIVHRDLTPANIFDDHGIIKVGDYGLSKYIANSRRSGHTDSVGTCHYMAPEIGKGNYGKPIDIYALGVILYEMVTGRVPFSGESVQEVMMKHLVDDPDLTDVPEPYRTIVHRAMAKDPARRWPSAQKMMDYLEEQRHGSAVQGAPVGASARRVGRQSVNTTHSPGADVLIIDEEPQPGDEIIFGPVRVHEQDASQPPPLVRPVTAATQGATHPGQRSTRIGSASPPLNNPWALAVGLALIALLFLQPHLLPAGVGIAVVAFLGYWLYHALQTSRKERQSREDDLRRAEVLQRLQRARMLCRAKSRWQRAHELFASWLAAAGWTSVVTGLGAAALAAAQPDVVQLATASLWVFLHATITSWALLLHGKLTEPQERPLRSLPIRLMLGYFLGLAGWGLQRAIGELPSGLVKFGPEPLLALDVSLSSHVLYTLGLFLLPAWLQFADAFRPHAFSTLRTLLVTAAAVALHFLVPLPFPLGIWTAFAAAVAAQMAARPIRWQDLVTT